MSSKSNNKKKSKSSKSSKGPKVSGYVSTIPASLGPFPRELVDTLKYCDQIPIPSIANGGFGLQTYRSNDIFDPDVTNTGHQPSGADNNASIYNRVLVFDCDAEITFAANTSIIHYFLLFSNGAMPNTTLAEFNSNCENIYAKTVTMGGISDKAVVVRHHAYLPKVNGVDRVKYFSDDAYASVTTASPAELMYLYIGVYNNSGGAVIPQISVVLRYRVKYFDIIPQNQSFESLLYRTYVRFFLNEWRISEKLRRFKCRDCGVPFVPISLVDYFRGRSIPSYDSVFPPILKD